MKTKLSLLLMACAIWAGPAGRSAELPPAADQPAPASPASPAAQASRPTVAPASVAAPPASAPRSQPGGVVLNFQGAPLAEVLNYLSEAAGFVVVQETPVEGTINVVSHQPLSPDETVDLLNSVLFDQGYTAIRNGRILKIVPLSEAAKHNLPVRVGRDPAQIPPKDEMVTQIIPVLHANAVQLVENLQALLSENAQIAADESSNAILMTDTQANIRRIAEIVYALDNSISGIAMVKVFPLRYADATELAKVIQQLFQGDSSSGSRRGPGGIPSFIMERMRGGRGGRDNNDNPVRAAASRVVAVADERTNSLVVGAPEEVMPTIEQIVAQIDTDVADLTEVRIFRLEHSDATEMAQLLMQLFSYDYYNTSSSRSSRFGGFRPPFFGGDRGGNSSRQDQSERKLEQSRVIAVGDPRTNSLLVSASHDLMVTIAEMVARLDSDTRRQQRVFVYPLEHADVENVASILENMFQSTSTRTGTRSTSRTSRQTGSSALQQRRSTGASIDPTLGGRNSGGLGGGSGRP